MDAFYESPVPVLLIGLLSAAILTVLYLNTRQRGVLIGIGAVAALVAGCLAMERYVKTDRERIAETLDELAAALRADGLPANTPEYVVPAVHEVFSPSALITRAAAEFNLQKVEITGASYSGLRVKVNRLTNPPKAEVRFNARISGHGRRGTLAASVGQRTYPLEFVLEMRYEQDRWVIGDQLRWNVKTFGSQANPRRYGFDTGQ